MEKVLCSEGVDFPVQSETKTQPTAGQHKLQSVVAVSNNEQNVPHTARMDKSTVPTPTKQPPPGEDQTSFRKPDVRAILSITSAALKSAFRRDPETGSPFGKLSRRRMLVVFCAELLGTALLLFMGCMGTVGGVLNPADQPPHLQVSLAFGMTVASIIQIIGHISVAHINPAVTLCAVMRGDLNLAAAGLYVVAQIIGAILGFGFLLSVTPTSANCVCATVPAESVSPLQAVLVEAGVTAVLILLCHGAWDARNAANTDSVPLKFGFLVAAVAMVSGPYTGGSMNPARTLAPAIWKGVWTHHWVYWIGPLAGSAVASLLYLTVFDERPTEAARRNRRNVEDGPAGAAEGNATEKAESIPLN